MNMKKILAALLALCVMLAGGFGALAEQDDVDVVGDLLRYFLKVDADAASDTEQGDAPESYAEPDDYVEGGEEYVFDDPDAEELPAVENHVAVSDFAVNESLPDDWMNILLLGTDSRGSTKFLRTDTMIVLSINPGEKRAKLTSLMRDIWVQLPDYGGQKLNAACVYGGPELTVRTINEYFGLNIEYYALVNMTCLVQIVDSLGGIRLDVSPAESRAISRLNAASSGAKDGSGKYISSRVPSGEQVLLDGKQVLAYSRIRKSDSDYARTERQRTVLATIAQRLKQENLLSLTGIVAGLLQYVETNMSMDQIMSIAAVCLKMDVDDMAQWRVPADGTYQDGMFGNTWCIKPDFEENARLLHQFIYED